MFSKKVLITIVVYNGADYIGDCLSSLNNVNYPPDQFEVMVVDNASTDNSVEIIKNNFPKVNLFILENNVGFAQGNNIGFDYALKNGYDYIYLLNQDTVVEPDFLQKAVDLISTDSLIGAVQSKLLLYDDKTKINSIGNELHYLGFGFAGGYKNDDKVMDPKEITYPSGASTLFNLQAIRQVGDFNPDFFMYHEDTDLGWRLWLGGYKIMLAPKSVVYHKYEFSRSIKKYYYMERNRYLTILQNYKMATLLLLLPALAVMDLAMIAYSFVGGWWKEEIKVYSYFFQPKVWSRIIATRAKVQAGRKVGDKKIASMLTGKIEFQDIDNPLLKYIVNPIFNLYWQIAKRIIWW